jgi:hypothetical protein
MKCFECDFSSLLSHSLITTFDAMVGFSLGMKPFFVTVETSG